MLASPSARSRFMLFGGLYFAQGVPWGFFTIALQLRLTGLGLSPGALGEVLTMAWLPWAAKPLLGPLVDRASFGRLGRRRPFVLAAEVGMASTLLVLATVDPSRSLRLFSILVLLHNVFAAAQDVGVDALALQVLTPDQRGRANGIMSAGKFAGVVVGGQGLIWVAGIAGWSAAFFTAVALLLLPAALILRVREADAPAVIRQRFFSLLMRSFALRTVIVAVVFLFVFNVSDSLIFPMTFPLYHRQLGYSDQQIATLATFGGLVSVGGSLLGGALSDRMGRRWPLFLACLGVAVTDLVFAAGRPLWTSYWFVLTVSFAGALSSGMVFASAIALCMDLTNPRLGATQFQIYMSIMNLRTSAATYAGGHLADRFSPRFMFVLAGVVQLIPLALLPWLNPRRAQAGFDRLAAEELSPNPETTSARDA